jgi:hypothetical protein
MITRRVLAAAAATTFTLSAAALAAQPKPGKKYSGFTSARKVNGFGAPVSFKVSDGSGSLLQFRYSTLGCLGSGGLGTGNPFKSKFATVKVGMLGVSGSSTFSVSGHKSSNVSHGYTTTTSTSVNGKFKTSKKAVGSITFSQKVTGKGVHESCGPVTVTFTATSK